MNPLHQSNPGPIDLIEWVAADATGLGLAGGSSKRLGHDSMVFEQEVLRKQIRFKSLEIYVVFFVIEKIQFLF